MIETAEELTTETADTPKRGRASRGRATSEEAIPDTGTRPAALKDGDSPEAAGTPVQQPRPGQPECMVFWWPESGTLRPFPAHVMQRNRIRGGWDINVYKWGHILKLQGIEVAAAPRSRCLTWGLPAEDAS